MNQQISNNTVQSLAAAAEAARRVAFIQASWHRDIVDQARVGFLAEWTKLGHRASDVDVYEVPGSFEIPLQAKLLAESGRYAAIVAAGFVVDGGIYRHDFVAGAVINALMRLQLDLSTPILSVVLTPQHFHEHQEHQTFFREHFLVKGAEAARACAATVGNIAAARALAA